MKTYTSVFATVCAVGGFVTSSQAFLQPSSILARECGPSRQRLAPCYGRAQIGLMDKRVSLFDAELCPANSEVEWKVTMPKIGVPKAAAAVSLRTNDIDDTCHGLGCVHVLLTTVCWLARCDM